MDGWPRDRLLRIFECRTDKWFVTIQETICDSKRREISCQNNGISPCLVAPPPPTHTNWKNKQESPPAWKQEAYRPRRNLSMTCIVGSGDGGTPVLVLSKVGVPCSVHVQEGILSWSCLGGVLLFFETRLGYHPTSFPPPPRKGPGTRDQGVTAVHMLCPCILTDSLPLTAVMSSRRWAAQPSGRNLLMITDNFSPLIGWILNTWQLCTGNNFMIKLRSQERMTITERSLYYRCKDFTDTHPYALYGVCLFNFF